MSKWTRNKIDVANIIEATSSTILWSDNYSFDSICLTHIGGNSNWDLTENIYFFLVNFLSEPLHLEHTEDL
jgi:hypothetical protein